ncbi:uncharacterized protein LOC110988023 [Acanthaster planci]|uniref:Uncharacterized protein LOC110988023 n=1 Tax=Acanthaster planci TaxID=133434 RepID=A0A8B7ZPG3_ACAPL|nr:uncharacterized protein LOC110988023 [Acanthaster planci]
MMKCIRVTAPKEPLVLCDDEPIPKAPDGGAVVKISYSGVCHSDVHFWKGDKSFARAEGEPTIFKCPCVPGHEIAGVLFSMGESATSNNQSGLKLGDHVVVFPWVHCGACLPCREGHGDFCDETQLRFAAIGVCFNGGHAQYVAVPDVRFLVPVPTSTPLEVACLLPCSGLTAFHAIEETLEFVKKVTQIAGR